MNLVLQYLSLLDMLTDNTGEEFPNVIVEVCFFVAIATVGKV